MLLLHISRRVNVLTPSGLSHAEIVCQTWPGESNVIHLIDSSDGPERGKTPNRIGLASSKKVIPFPNRNLDPSERMEPSITIAYFSVRNMSWTNDVIGFSSGMWKYWFGVPFLKSELNVKKNILIWEHNWWNERL